MIAIKDAIEDSDSSLNGNVTFAGCYAGSFSLSFAGDVVKLGPRFHLSFAEHKGPDLLLSDYDAFLIVGLRFNFQHAANVYAKHRLWQHATEDHYIISEKALQSSIKDKLSRTLAVDLARNLRQHTDKPIFLIPQPNPNEVLKSMPLTTDQLKELHERWQVFFQDEVGIEVYRAFVRAAEAVADDLSAKFFPQPADTMTPVFTDNSYRVKFKPKFEAPQGGANAVPPREGDILHANPVFGHRVMKQIEPLLTGASRDAIHSASLTTF
jgi:hypothetical protein